MAALRLIGLLLLALGWNGFPQAWAVDSPPAPTLEAMYLGLSTGALRSATLQSLPKGTVLRTGALTVTESQVTAEIGKAPAVMQASLKINRVFVLEQLATRVLLLAEAREWATAARREVKGESETALLNAYLRSVAETATVSDAELRAFYAANTEMMGGASFENVQSDLKTYLLKENRQRAVETHVNTLSERRPVELDATWIKAQASPALDTPVDRARRAGKPAVVDFGADGCRPCEMMTPILQELRETYTRQCAVLFIHVREQPVLATRYGISSIPVQVFFDKDGKEVFRHVGFFPKAQMLEQLAKLGVK